MAELKTKRHISAIYLATFNQEGQEDELYDLFFDCGDDACIPFVVDTNFPYAEEEQWCLALSKELISLGAEEGETIYIEN